MGLSYPPTIKKQRSDERITHKQAYGERRRSSINAREAERAAAAAEQRDRQMKAKNKTSTKYPKRDIMLLKQVFDSYDCDGSGTIEKEELFEALQKQKTQTRRVTVEKKNLEERQAEKGLFLVEFSESIFKTLDINDDKRVDFSELLKLIYPLASDAEQKTMKSWVVDKHMEHPDEPDDSTLTLEQEGTIRGVFALYDKDRSGGISPIELRQAMRRCGLTMEDTEEIFAEADNDKSGSIEFDEFREMMRQTLFNSEDVTSRMMYGKCSRSNSLKRFLAQR